MNKNISINQKAKNNNNNNNQQSLNFYKFKSIIQINNRTK